MFYEVLLITILVGSVFSSENCENASESFEFHLATKTPYRLVANKVDKRINIENCEPKKIWMLVRHGTRNPSASLIQKIKERLPKIRDIVLANNKKPTELLRNSDLYTLQKWKTKLEEKEEKKLAHEGEDEMLELAERMQARFPNLFPSAYSNTSYYFKYTASQRTKASARYFAAGLFGRQAVRHVWYPPALKKDPILRFYKLCARWTNEVKKNPKSLQERKLFEKSTDMQKVVNSVNKGLNLTKEKLSLEDVYLIYMTCAFETAWHRTKKSSWCSLLPSESFKVLEYGEDLKYYYRDGYGYELTYEQACPAFNDMINYFERDSDFPKAIVYFTHSGTLLKMLAHLGLYKDDKPLSQKNFKQNTNRKWKVSQIDPFGNNLAFVLHRCGEDYKVMVLHQERIVQLPQCEDLCDLNQIKKHYARSINNCNFDEICSIENENENENEF